MIRNLFTLLFLLSSQVLWSNELLSEFPFKLINEHIHFKMTVNGSEPLNFVFDTGAGGSVIDEKTAKALDLKIRGKSPVMGASGTTYISQTGGVEIMLKDVGLANVEFLVMDLSHLGDEDAPIDGIIGATVLNYFGVELNFDDSMIRLYDRSSYTPEQGWERKRIAIQGSNIPAVVGTFSLPTGEVLEGPYLLDTGAALTLVLNSPFVKENNLINELGPHYSYSGQSLVEEYKDEITKLEAYKVFGHTFENMSVHLSRDSKGVTAQRDLHGILGLSILKRFNMVFDYYRQVVYLSPSKYYEEDFHFNHDGLKLKKNNRAYEVVAVFEGSIAQELGIREGDLILSLDGRNDFTRHTFHHYIEAADKAVEVKLKRDGKEMTFELKPRSML